VNRLLTSALFFTVAVTITACSFNRQSPPSETNNQSARNANQPAKLETAPPQAQPVELHQAQPSGTNPAGGEWVESKYAYAGRVGRFGGES